MRNAAAGTPRKPGGRAGGRKPHGGAGQRTQALPNAVEAYVGALQAAPLPTKVATSAVLFAASDSLAQALKPEAKVDVARVARYALFGATVHAPLFSAFYAASDELYDNVLHLEPTAAVVAKVLTDQLVFTPLLFLPLFFSVMALLRGESVAQARACAIAALPLDGVTPTLVANWRVWFPANALNYQLPTDTRILFVNLVSLGWTVYLSNVEREEAEEATAR